MTTVEKAFLWLEEELREAVPRPTLDMIEEALGVEVTGMSDVPFPDYRDRLYPRIGSIRNGSGLSAGIRYFRPDLIGNDADLETFAAVSLANYHSYRVRLGRLLPTDVPRNLVSRALPQKINPFFLYVDGRYEYFPREDFFGLGGDSREANESDFRLERAAYNVVGGYRYGPRVSAGFRAGFSRIAIGPGDDDRFPDTQTLFDPLAAPGLDANADFFESAASLSVDLTERSGDPHRGALLELSFERHDDTEEERFQFNRFAIDARGYLSLGSPQRVFAVWLLASSDQPDSGSRVPFYLQRTLGGSRTLRGFSDRRFRGKNLLHVSVEYRWEAAPGWELAVFYDAGKVFQDQDDFSFDDLRESYGFGMRFEAQGGTFLRVDAANSEEGPRLHLAVVRSF